MLDHKFCSLHQLLTENKLLLKECSLGNFGCSGKTSGGDSDLSNKFFKNTSIYGNTEASLSMFIIKVCSSEIRKSLNIKRYCSKVKDLSLRWFGHVSRISHQAKPDIRAQGHKRAGT